MRSMRAPLLVLFCTVALLASTSVSAQQLQIDKFAQQLDHEFFDADGELVASGTFVEMSGSKAVIRQDDGTEVKILIANLSEEDKEWVKEIAKQQKAREAARKKFQKLLEDNLTSQTEAKVVTGLKGVAKLGKDAPFAATVVEKYLGKQHSEKVRSAAFLAFAATKRATQAGVNDVLTALMNDRAGVNEKIANNPREFMKTMASFGDLAVPYLKMAAFSGALIPDQTDVDPPSSPMSGLSKTRRRIRASAVSAFAEMPNEESLEIVIEVLRATEEDPEDERDVPSVKACLTAIGDIGILTDDVRWAMRDYAEDEEYAKTVERAVEKIKKANEEDADGE